MPPNLFPNVLSNVVLNVVMKVSVNVVVIVAFDVTAYVFLKGLQLRPLKILLGCF